MAQQHNNILNQSLFSHIFLYNASVRMKNPYADSFSTRVNIVCLNCVIIMKFIEAFHSSPLPRPTRFKCGCLFINLSVLPLWLSVCVYVDNGSIIIYINHYY